MYVPFSVISLVLFASPGFTNSLFTNATVDDTTEVTSLNGTLLNATDIPAVMTNKSSNPDQIQFPLKPPIKRPSNWSPCTQSKGVRSPCLLAGKHIKGDKLAVRKHIKKAGIANSEQYEAYSFALKHGLVKKGFVISHIKVTNKMKAGSEGLVSIVKGGTLEKEVVLLMESQKGRKMNFFIEIYMSPAATAYKSLLGSLISNLQSL